MNNVAKRVVKTSGSGILALALLVLSSCGSKQATNTQNTVSEYPVMKLKAENLTTHINFPATIQGIQEIEIRPKIEGYIEKINVAEGASVKKGQLLFHIFNPSYRDAVETAEASLKSAEADLATAKLDLAKVQPLVESDIVSKYESESVKLTVDAQEAAVTQAKAALATARTNLSYTDVRSPYDGVIGSIPYRVGSLVSSSSTDALTTLAENKEMYAYFSMNEKDLMQLARTLEGKSMQEKLAKIESAHLILSDGSTYQFAGKLEMASSIVDSETGSVRMKAVFPNEDGLLWSGASATVSLEKTHSASLVIPQSATAELLNKVVVYTVDQDNKVKAKNVEVSATDDGKSYIVESGLSENEQIILEGFTGLSDGTEIKAKAAKLAEETSTPNSNNGI